METLEFLKKMMEDEMRISKEFSLGANEKFIKELSEAIEELEALQNRSCDDCLHNSRPKYKEPCSNCMWVNEFDNWEAKQ